MSSRTLVRAQAATWLPLLVGTVATVMPSPVRVPLVFVAAFLIGRAVRHSPARIGVLLVLPPIVRAAVAAGWSATLIAVLVPAFVATMFIVGLVAEWGASTAKQANAT